MTTELEEDGYPTLHEMNLALQLAGKPTYMRRGNAIKAWKKLPKAKSQAPKPAIPAIDWVKTPYEGRRVWTPRGEGRILKADSARDPKQFLVKLVDGRECAYKASRARFFALDDSYRDSYVHDTTTRTESGAVSVHCGDELAEALLGLCQAELGAVCRDNGLGAEFEAAKARLNPGMVSMAMRNRLRGKIRRGEKVRVFSKTFGGAK